MFWVNMAFEFLEKGRDGKAVERKEGELRGREWVECKGRHMRLHRGRGEGRRDFVSVKLQFLTEGLIS